MGPDKDYLTDIHDAENFGYDLASPWTRLAAVIVENIIIYIPFYFIAGSTALYVEEDMFEIMPNLIQTGYTAITGAFFYSLWSGNLGHKIFGLKVISAVDGSDQKKAVTGAIREVLKSVMGIFIIPSIWLLWDDKKQNLYDKITKTLVVYRP